MFPSFASGFFNLLLVRFHLAGIIVKHLTQGRNNEAWVGVEPSTLRSGRRKNDALNHSVSNAIIISCRLKLVRVVLALENWKALRVIEDHDQSETSDHKQLTLLRSFRPRQCR